MPRLGAAGEQGGETRLGFRHRLVQFRAMLILLDGTRSRTDIHVLALGVESGSEFAFTIPAPSDGKAVRLRTVADYPATWPSVRGQKEDAEQKSSSSDQF